MDLIFERLLARLKEEFKDTFELWFKHLRFVTFKNNLLVLEAPDKFFKESIELRFKEKIKSILRNIYGNSSPIEVEIITPKDETLSQKVNVLVEESELNPRYTFDTFVVGESNRFAHASALSVVESPTRTYNPLFIYGGVGLGKTHLIQAIGNSIRKYKSFFRVKYTTTENFMNDFIEGVRKQEKQEIFKRKYRQIDILLIDDIHFLSGKEQTQVEFFHTFNSLYESRKQIVLTSDRPPWEIPALEDRLRSRFEWGLITDLQPPDYETRIAILRKKVEYENLQVNDDILEFIAQRFKFNIRELEGALTRVVAYASINKIKLTLDVAKTILKDVFHIKEKPITIDLIKQEVAKYFQILPEDLLSKHRSNKFTLSRQIAMYIAKQTLGLSLTEIGKEFLRDHTTVLYACNKIKSLIENNAKVKEAVNKILDNIKKFVN
jgi:chromosomal replication initiator protein